MKHETCARVRRTIPFLVEGEATPLEALDCASHLSSCSRCADQETRARREVDAGVMKNLPVRPVPDIAGRVLHTLRAMRGSVNAGAALKWSSLGVLFILAGIPALIPDATLRIGRSAVTRLGELLDFEEILARMLDLLPGFLPSLTSLTDAARGVSPSAGGGLPPAGPFVALMLGAIAAGFVVALLSGGLVLRAAQAARSGTTSSPNPTNRSFDIPGRLP